MRTLICVVVCVAGVCCGVYALAVFAATAPVASGEPQIAYQPTSKIIMFYAAFALIGGLFAGLAAPTRLLRYAAALPVACGLAALWAVQGIWGLVFP